MLNVHQESTFHFKLGHKVNLAFTGQKPVRGCATNKKKGLICWILWGLSPFFPRERKWMQEEVEEKRNEISVLYRSVLNFLLHLLFYSCPFFVWHDTLFLFSRLSVWVKCRHFPFIPPQKKIKIRMQVSADILLVMYMGGLSYNHCAYPWLEGAHFQPILIQRAPCARRLLYLCVRKMGSGTENCFTLLGYIHGVGRVSVRLSP